MLGSIIRRLLRHGHTRTDGWLASATALHQAGRYAEAAAVCEQRLRDAGDDSLALQSHAAALLAQGRTDEGLGQLQKAAALAGADAQPHVNIARIFTAIGRLDAAVGSYRRALAIQPEHPEAEAALVGLLRALDRYDEMEQACRTAIESGGDTAARRHALGIALFEQGRVGDAIRELEQALALEPGSATVHSNILRALNYDPGERSPREIFEAHLEWARQHETPRIATARGAVKGHERPRLRVGYVSRYFRKHAVTFFLESVIEHHDREALEIVLFADVERPDAYSERLKSHGARWRSTLGANDTALAQIVRDEQIDILVDLAGHTDGNRLLAFAERPAPVQVTWNGYPNTTGMRAIDYRITDPLCDPPGTTEHLHSEKLVRLPSIFMSWRPPPDAPDPGPLPALDAGHVTFGSFNSCYKITERTVRLWARVLSTVDRSRLVFLAVPHGQAQARLRKLFTEQGIPGERLEFRPRMSHEAFLEAHRGVDIALDAFPYHGTTTTCFSLWMGVPVMTLVGPTHVSRVGLTLLSNAGFPELAAETDDDFVMRAATLARDLRALAEIRSGLRERILASPLADGAGCARALEQAYRTMWQHSTAASGA